MRRSRALPQAMLGRLERWADAITRDVVALSLAGRDPRVPWYAKALALAVAAYAFSPIDLIPDFIPVLGLLDDLVIVPLGILLVIKLVPPGIMAEHRTRAAVLREIPRGTVAAMAVVTIWIAFAAGAGWLAWVSLQGHS
jgi:uncharacterized membrane protein YkvA (DUF1232 family)